MDEMNRYRAELERFFSILWHDRPHTLVFGEGPSSHPRLMLIGEAPGEMETRQGRPFVGKAGKNLDEFLQVLEIKREEIYITNAVKVRPTRLSPKGTLSNRPPNREELSLFLPKLYEEILLVQPACIVTLGNVPLRALLGNEAVIGSMHGKWTIAQVANQGRREHFELFPLYHPASIIYNRALSIPYQEDLQKLKRTLPL